MELICSILANPPIMLSGSAMLSSIGGEHGVVPIRKPLLDLMSSCATLTSRENVDPLSILR